jgi:hypothetical protein
VTDGHLVLVRGAGCAALDDQLEAVHAAAPIEDAISLEDDIALAERLAECRRRAGLDLRACQAEAPRLCAPVEAEPARRRHSASALDGARAKSLGFKTPAEAFLENLRCCT